MNLTLKKYLLPVAFLTLVSGCAFNGRFHRPDKIPFDNYVFPSYDLAGDTTYIDYDSLSQQITLRDHNFDTINASYAIVATQFESESGNLLSGWWMKPKSRESLGTILHFHGTSQNILAQYQSIAPLIDYGFEVFTFDYSGYGFSQGKATRKNALLDAYAAIEFVNNERPYGKKVLYGQSYGGYLAAVAASNRQEYIDGMVIEGAFSSHKEEAKFEVPFWGNLVKNEQVASEEISKNSQPVLVIHSSEDKKVPAKFGKEIYEQANVPKEYFQIEKSHCMGLAHYSQEIAGKILFMLSDN